MGAVMFRGQNQTVRFEITHGMEVTAHGRISVYPPQGRYQLIVDQLLPAGQGDLHLAFEALKKKLSAEGLFDAGLKKPLPKYPMRIGLVTSPTGAAIRDMINIFKRRFPLAELQLLPVKVQGEGAATEIAEAIATFNQLQECQVLIIGRGGGSLEDLWAFNEEVVARAIADSIIPVVSAVGHETDTTISDFVADHRAPTPSAAAEQVVPDGIMLMTTLTNHSKHLIEGMGNRIQKQENLLNSLERSYALKRPVIMVDQLMQHLDHLQDRSLRASKERIDRLMGKLDAMAQQIDVLNPLSILKRGYSVVSSAAGNIVRSVSEIKVKDSIHIRLSDGEVETSITAIKPKE